MTSNMGREGQFDFGVFSTPSPFIVDDGGKMKIRKCCAPTSHIYHLRILIMHLVIVGGFTTAFLS